jgi:putative SOS response-associated peptidase YedK
LVIVLASVIVPSQAKVTVPPPAIAARKAASVQLVTTPAASAATGRKSINARARMRPRFVDFMNDWFARRHLVIISDSFVSFRAMVVGPVSFEFQGLFILTSVVAG